MAAGNQKKESKRVMPSVTQVSSRVSRATGGLNSRATKSTPAAQRPGQTPRSQSPTKQSVRGGQEKGQGSKKSAMPTRPAAAPPPRNDPSDTRFIQWAHNKWRNLEPHHQQRVLSTVLLGLSLLLFASLTVFRSVPVLRDINKFSLVFFGWSAYLLSLGLVAFALAHLTEGIQNRRFLRGSTVIGLTCIWLLLLIESRLLFGKGVGVLAAILVIPLLGWPAPTGHVITLGLLLIAVVITFRITFGHVLMVARAVRSVVVRNQKNAPENRPTAPSPFLGQRPKYSRYGTGQTKASPAPTPTPNRQATQQPIRPGRPPIEDEEDISTIDFEADFDEDDPQDDINLHKQQIGHVPRGPREAVDQNEPPDPVKGVRQQPLPFNQAPNQPPQPATRRVAKKLTPLEALAPNPSLVGKPKATVRAIDIPVDSKSLWKLPDTSLLNNPEEAKLHILGDDTTALAKMIQETLRSFRVEAEVRPEDISIGPTVIRFGIRPTGKPETKMDEKSGKMVSVKDTSGNIVYESRTRVSRIMALQNDLALVLEAKTIRMEAPVPGRPYVGVEIPNKNSRLVTLREVLESKEYQATKAKSKLAIVLGRDVAGQVRIGDLARMPHLLIAGATGAGKCLAYDEPVFLADGRVTKVQELIGRTVQVVGITDTQTMQQTPVPATFTENGVQEVFEIELDNGVILRRTGEHPLWAARLDENQHVGRQLDGKAARRTRAIDAGWFQTKDLRVCGNRPNFDGHVILCPLALHLGLAGTYTHKDNGHAGAWSWHTPMVDTWQERVGSTVKAEKLATAVKELEKNRENAATEWTSWRRARPLPDQKFSDCPAGYEWRKIVAIRRVTTPTVNIEVYSENHAFVGYAVEHNSVCINTIIASILTQATPDDVRMLMVDPKMVELNMYNGIPHLLSPVVTEVDKVVPLLKNAISEMERRYRLFSQLNVRNLDGYRKLRAEKAAHGDTSLKVLPAIVIIIDELADLMMAAPEEVEGMICRLAQLARATGMHLVIATQRPSVDVITGLIKANIPTRISFMVSSAVDSRTIIDMGGAERLLGRGDMLYLPADAGRPERIQGAFLADDEAEKLVEYWRQQAVQYAVQAGNGGVAPAAMSVPAVVEPGWEIKEEPEDEFELDDDLLDEAEEVVRDFGKASISLLQRRLRIGYSRAARLIDLLEERGIIGHAEQGGRVREVLDDRNGGHDRRGGEGHTLADEAADILAEEKARNEFLRKQAAAGKWSQQGQPSSGDEGKTVK